MTEVHSNLMHASGFRVCFHQRQPFVFLQDFDSSESALTIFRDNLVSKAFSAFGSVDSLEASVDIQLLPRRSAFNDGEIPFINQMLSKSIGECLLPISIFCQDATTGGDPVQAMDWLNAFAKPFLHEIQQGRLWSTAACDNDLIARLINDPVMFSLVQN